MLVVLYDRTSPLDPLWNVRSLGLTATGSAYSASYLKKAKLVHWSGHFKPWNRLAPEQQLWDQYFVGDPLGKFQPIRKSHWKPYDSLESHISQWLKPMKIYFSSIDMCCYFCKKFCYPLLEFFTRFCNYGPLWTHYRCSVMAFGSDERVILSNGNKIKRTGKSIYSPEWLY